MSISRRVDSLLDSWHAPGTEGDILLRAELDALAAAHPDRLKVWYTLDLYLLPLLNE